MSADDGFRPLADPRYFDDTDDADLGDDTRFGGDASGDRAQGDDSSGGQQCFFGGARQQSHSWPPAPGSPTPSPPGFLRVAGGLFLIAIGVEFLLELMLPFDVEITTLAIGLLLLAWWTRSGQMWAYIGGMITSGIGVGSLLAGIVPEPVGGLLGALGTAVGFAILAARPPYLKWAWWPAAIIAFFSIAGFGIAVATALFSSASSSVMLPLALVVAGTVLLTRNALSPGTRNTLLIGCAVVFVLAASARASETISPIGEWFDRSEAIHHTIDLPALAGRTLVIESGSGDITVMNGGELATLGLTRNIPLIVDEGSERVVVANLRATTAVLHVPVGTSVEISTGSGDVVLKELTWRSEQGVTVRTGSGDVVAVVTGDPDVRVSTGSGKAVVDGSPMLGGGEELSGADTGLLAITTGSGDVVVQRLAPPPRPSIPGSRSEPGVTSAELSG